MNRNSQNREEPVRGTVDEPIDEGPPFPHRGKHHQGSGGSRLEERIEKGGAILLKFEHLLMLSFLVVASFLGGVDYLKYKTQSLFGGPEPLPNTPSVQPGSEQLTDGEQTPKPDAVASNQHANDAIIIDGKQSSDSTSPMRSKGRNRIANPAYARVLPPEPRTVAGPCAGKPFPQFTTRIGVTYSPRCENGKWRLREVTSVASIPSTWGDAPAGQR